MKDKIIVIIFKRLLKGCIINVRNSPVKIWIKPEILNASIKHTLHLLYVV